MQQIDCVLTLKSCRTVVGKENAAKATAAAKRKLSEDALQSRANDDTKPAAQPNGKAPVTKRAKHAAANGAATNGHAANGAANGHTAEPMADATTANRSGRQVCSCRCLRPVSLIDNPCRRALSVW